MDNVFTWQRVACLSKKIIIYTKGTVSGEKVKKNRYMIAAVFLEQLYLCFVLQHFFIIN